MLPSDDAKHIALANAGHESTMVPNSRFHSDAVKSQQASSATAWLHLPDHTTAAAQATACHSPPAPPMAHEPTMLPLEATVDDLSATAMSIDTPSYARSMAMGQLGLPTQVMATPFGLSQSLSEAMSIDGPQRMSFWDTAASATTGELVNSALLLTFDH